jgi:uncharacterized membrane protein
MTDQRLEIIIGILLRVGVLLSAAVVLGGGMWLLFDCGQALPNYHQFLPPANTLRSPRAIVAALGHPNPALLIQFGLLLLIATPVARVIVSLIAFAIQHDRLYVVITAIVLAILLYSLAGVRG